MNEQQHKFPAAVHSTLDDANLTAEEFRVLLHICRRCGDEKNGRQCDSAISTMAKKCRLHPDTVRQILPRLVALKWVSVIERPGRTKVHVARFPDPSGLKGGVWGGMVSSEGLPLEGAPPSGLEVGQPYGSKGDEGIPLRDTIKGTSLDMLSMDTEIKKPSSKTANNSTAESIYQAYPRKVGKRDAIKAILKSLKGYDAAFLLERTTAYAAAIDWQQQRFIPHPAKWFNGERFNDDPDDWAAPPPTVTPTPQTPAGSVTIGGRLFRS
ncbi:hypothetical protein HQ447_20035 [bacterium]|nr:hypothetical protein [bacterium]